jgi:predicted nucleic acid-binding protein
LTTLLLDASVILAAFDPEDENYEPAGTLLTDAEFTLATLDLARYEVTNVAIRAWRAPETVTPLLAAIDQIEADGGVIEATSPLLSRAADLAENHAISVYDATYAAAAGAGRMLISCDARDLVSKGLARMPRDARNTPADDAD